MNLEKLLKSHEGKQLEFKRDASSPGPILRTVTAFANCAGGVLLIGVEDKTRAVRGVHDVLETQERLANIISTGIAPPLMPAIEVLPWRNKSILAIEVFPGASSPHHLIDLGPEHGTYIRVGASNRKADAATREELRRSAHREAFDEEPVPQLKSEAIDFRAASECFAPHRNLTMRDLDTLHVIIKHQGRRVPSRGGIILFGKERKLQFPDAWIHAGRFRGVNKTHIIDNKEFHAYPVQAAQEAAEFVRLHAAQAIRIEGMRSDERWSIPLPAVREAIINAVVHADYSQTGSPIRVLIFDDRVEVESPGLLPFGLVIEDILRGISRLRNRVIGRVFKELRLIEQWGSGIGRMIDCCRASGLPPPHFEEIGTHFRVTFRLDKCGGVELDEISTRILDAIRERSRLNTQTLATLVGLSARSTRTRLKSLVERGLIAEIGSGPNDPKRVYVAT